mmetsp:Transcript_21184/g.54242  ORF Transcript_21184/g.54242 Transcript_21184/m.54242 type:complete len:93 (-) Transcript_21184:319-597(-)
MRVLCAAHRLESTDVSTFGLHDVKRLLDRPPPEDSVAKRSPRAINDGGVNTPLTAPLSIALPSDIVPPTRTASEVGGSSPSGRGAFGTGDSV